MKLKNKKYDELQLLNRYKIGFQAMIIFAVLVLLNGLIKEHVTVWATPLTEAFIIIYVPLIYFFTMALIKNAYFRKMDDLNVIIIIFGIVLTINTIVTFFSIAEGTFVLIENNKLSSSITQLLLNIFWAILFFGVLLKKVNDKRLDKADR